MEPEGVLAFILQSSLPGTADLQAGTRKEKPHAATDMTLGVDAVGTCARNRDIGCIVHIDASAHGKTSTEHEAVAVDGADGKNQRIRLKKADPDWIEALVKDPKRGEKSADGERKIRIRNIVQLSVIHVLGYRSLVGASSKWPLKLALELGA